MVGLLSVVVHNLYVVCIAILPVETHPSLIVDANAVLSLAVLAQLLKSVRRRISKVVDRVRVTEHPKLAQSDRLDVAGQLARELAMK
jgi:hypothetical protein